LKGFFLFVSSTLQPLLQKLLQSYLEIDLALLVNFETPRNLNLWGISKSSTTTVARYEVWGDSLIKAQTIVCDKLPQWNEQLFRLHSLTL
jgi:hypothetical protein